MKIQTPILTLLFFLLVLPLSSAIISESENYRINFVVKPSFESESESAKFTSIINPISGQQMGVYQGFLLIPELQPVVIEERITLGTGVGFTTSYQKQAQLEEIEKQILEITCGEDESFIKRLFSKCKIPDNGICEDGENFLMDGDCMVSLKDLTTGRLFKYMWFLRFVFLLSIFMLFRDSSKYPIIVAILVLLFVYNGAFIKPGIDYDMMACTDINFLINFGYCIMPDQPIVGWLIGFALIALVLRYFSSKDKEGPRKKKIADYRKVYK